MKFLSKLFMQPEPYNINCEYAICQLHSLIRQSQIATLNTQTSWFCSPPVVILTCVWCCNDCNGSVLIRSVHLANVWVLGEIRLFDTAAPLIASRYMWQAANCEGDTCSYRCRDNCNKASPVGRASLYLAVNVIRDALLFFPLCCHGYSKWN